MKSSIKTLTIALGIFGVATMANADPILCSADEGVPDTSTTTASGLSTSNVTLGANAADNCWGIVSGNDTVSNAWDGSLALNDLAQWDAAGEDKDGNAVPEKYVAGTIGDVDFWLSDVTTGTSGTFQLNWEDAGAADPTYNFTTDLVFTLKSGTSFASYLFGDLLFSSDGNSGGAYTIAFKNNGGQIGAISHLAVYHTGYTMSSSNGGGTGSSEIPAPGTVSLLGIAMLGGLMAWRRRRTDA